MIPTYAASFSSLPPGLLLLLGLFWGSVLGLFFFGGLWLTIRTLPSSRRPHLLWSCSLALRLVLFLAGVLPLLRMGFATWPGALAGILLVRLLLTRRLRPQGEGL